MKIMTDHSNLLLQMLTACESLLHELQIIWDEVGENDAEKDSILSEIQQECVEVFRRKVDQANRLRAQLKQEIAEAESELAAICSAMGERPVHIRQSDHNPQSLKAELRAIFPQIEEMRKRKVDRKNKFIDVLDKIHHIKHDVYRSSDINPSNLNIDEADLSTWKLEELQLELHTLQKEKSERMELVLDYLNCLCSLCLVLGLDFEKIVNKIHPSLWEAEGSKDISDGTITQLRTAVKSLKELKLHRMRQLQDLAASLLELWNLMDTPIEEQQIFHKVTCHIAASEDEILEPNMLSVDCINYIEKEVSRLEDLKTSIMIELVLKRKEELDDICKKTHLVPDKDNAIEIAIHAVESGAVDATYVLEQIEIKIASVKEEALNRKEILEKVEKWQAACEEEVWLEKYNKDDNRYNAVRGAHLVLKRAERARALVNKLPAMVDILTSQVTDWENTNGVFTYDGVRLLCMLERYMIQRKEKELEQKRQRDRKKVQGQILVEKEARYGSKPSPLKNLNLKQGSRLTCGVANNRRLSLGATILQTPKPRKLHSVNPTPNTRNAKRTEGMITLDRHAATADGRKKLDMFAIPAKHQPHSVVKPHEKELPVTRKPFSPISCTKSSKTDNTTNISSDMKKTAHHTQKVLNNQTPLSTPSKTISRAQEESAHHTQKVLNNQTPLSTPSKIISRAQEESGTPQTTKATAVSTPSTASIPMLTAITPTPVVPPLSTTNSSREETEYSFEERRAGFVLPGSKLRPAF